MVDANAASPAKDLFFAVVFTVLLAIAGGTVPVLGLFSTFFWAVPVAVLTAKAGIKSGAAVVFCSGIVLAVLTAPIWAATSAVQFGGLGLLLGGLFREGRSSSQIVVFGIALAVLLSGLVFFVPMLPGIPQASMISEIRGSTDSIITLWRDSGVLDKLQQQGLTAEEVRASLQEGVHWVLRLLPSIIAVAAAGSAFVNFLAARIVLFRSGSSVPEFPVFREWTVPWYTAWIVIAGLGLALLGDYLKAETVLIVGENLVYLYLPLAFVIGLSVVVYGLAAIKNRTLKAVFLVGGVIYLPLTVVMLLLIGAFDPLFDFRKINLKRTKE